MGDRSPGRVQELLRRSKRPDCEAGRAEQDLQSRGRDTSSSTTHTARACDVAISRMLRPRAVATYIGPCV